MNNDSQYRQSDESVNRRHDLDGKPYYCVICGLGFGEYMACDGLACILESIEKSESRQKTHNDISQILSDALSNGDRDEG